MPELEMSLVRNLQPDSVPSTLMIAAGTSIVTRGLRLFCSCGSSLGAPQIITVLPPESCVPITVENHNPLNVFTAASLPNLRRVPLGNILFASRVVLRETHM